MTANTDPIVQKYFYSWITQDKYLPTKFSCAGAKGVDIFGSDVILSTHSQTDIISLPNNSYPTSIGDIITSQNSYIYDLSWNVIYRLYQSNGTNVRNYVDHTVNWVDYRYLISQKRLHRYTPDALYSYSDLDWAGTNRAFDWSNYIVHTPWSTVAFTWSNVAVIDKQYVLSFQVDDMTAGSFTINIGNDTAQTISAEWKYVLNFKASNTNWVIITPTSTFNGKITTEGMIWEASLVEAVQELTNNTNVAPYLVDQWDLYIGNWNIVAVVDTLWVKIDALILPKSEEIVDITRDENYIFLWARASKYSKVYFWDGISENPTAYKLWKNEIIQSVENQWDFCIVITGNNNQTKKVRQTNGYTRQLVRNIPYGIWSTATGSKTGIYPALPIYYSNTDTNGNNTNTNNMSSFWDMVFIPWIDSIITYWRKNAWLPLAFCNQYPLVNCSDIYTIYASDEDLYIWYNDREEDTAKIIKYKLNNNYITGDTTLFGTRWLLELNPIYWLGKDINTGVGTNIGIETPANTFMVWMYRLDKQDNKYTLVIDNTTVTITPTVWSIYRFGSTDRMTIESVIAKWNLLYIWFNQTISATLLFHDSSISKVSWTGDTIVNFIDKYNYSLYGIIDWSLEIELTNRYRNLPEKFNEIEFAIELNSIDWIYTPRLKDLTLSRDMKSDG